jgi:hypothetical protein
MQPWIEQHPEWLSVTVPIFFVGVWLLIFAVISVVGGWQTLAERFRSDGSFDGAVWRWQSAYFRYRVHYGGCLIVGCNREGLYIRILFPFRFMHPPLFVPWREISLTTSRYWLMGEVGRFQLGRETQIPFTVGERLLGRIRGEVGDLTSLTLT